MPNITINTDALTDTEKAIAEFLAAKVRQTEEEKAKRLWKPEYLETYYGIGFNGDIASSTNTNSLFDKEAWAIGNCFKTIEEAKFAAERLKVIVELERFAKEKNPPCFKNDDLTRKWIIVIRNSTGDVEPNWVTSMYPCVTFATEEIAKAAIEKSGKDRLRKYYFGVTKE